jgi:hypothetical protein
MNKHRWEASERFPYGECRHCGKSSADEVHMEIRAADCPHGEPGGCIACRRTALKKMVDEAVKQGHCIHGTPANEVCDQCVKAWKDVGLLHPNWVRELQERSRIAGDVVVGKAPSNLLNERVLAQDEKRRAETHITEIIEDFARLARPKYMAGYEEHGGDLATKGNILWLLDMIEQEAIDQFVYVRTLRSRIAGADPEKP